MSRDRAGLSAAASAARPVRSSTNGRTEALTAYVSLLGEAARSFVKSVSQGWDEFWFSQRDPTVLGIMRWLVGGMLVYTHAVWGLDLPAFLGSAGWNSPEVLAVVQQDRIVPSFWWFVADEWLFPVHCVCMLVLVAFWIGLATRVTSLLSLLITISYAYRAHMANFGLDQINGILCFYLCIGPCGHTFLWIVFFRSGKQSGVPLEPQVCACPLK